MKNRRVSGALLALVILTVTSGCYRYVPTAVSTTPPGTRVRVAVTEQGARELADIGAGDRDGLRLDGTVVGLDGTDLLVRVPIGAREEGFQTSVLEQTVRFPVDEIVGIQHRELNGLATGLMVGGAAVVVAGLVAIIVDPLGGGGVDPETPPDEAVVSFPIVSFGFGR